MKNLNKISISEDHTSIDMKQRMTTPDGGYVMDKSSTIESKDERDPDFTAAMDSFRFLFEPLLGFSKDYLKDARVSTIGFKDNNGLLGITVAIVKPVPCSNRPLVINVPLIQEEDTNKETGDLIMNKKFMAHLERIVDHAIAFTQGKRSQEDLFDFIEQEKVIEDTEESSDANSKKLSVVG